MHGEVERHIEQSGLAWTHLRAGESPSHPRRRGQSSSRTGSRSTPPMGCSSCSPSGARARRRPPGRRSARSSDASQSASPGLPDGTRRSSAARRPRQESEFGRGSAPPFVFGPRRPSSSGPGPSSPALESTSPAGTVSSRRRHNRASPSADRPDSCTNLRTPITARGLNPPNSRIPRLVPTFVPTRSGASRAGPGRRRPGLAPRPSRCPGTWSRTRRSGPPGRRCPRPRR